MKKNDPKIKKLINTVKKCARSVYEELGAGRINLEPSP